MTCIFGNDAYDAVIKLLEDIGYDFGGSIGDGYCWGHYMVIYSNNAQEKIKCGYVFSFTDPKIENIKDYIDILKEFYAKRITKTEGVIR
jgi:hypothetical protein